MNEDRPEMPTPAQMQAAMRAAMAEDRRRRRAAAEERNRLRVKAARGWVKHPQGATKAGPRPDRRAKAKAGRKAARKNR